MADDTKGAPLPPPTVREQLDAELDAALLDALQHGVTVSDKEGNVLTVTAPHQYLEIARKRLADLGLTKVVDSESDAAKIASELQLYNPNIYDVKLPDVDDGEQANVA